MQEVSAPMYKRVLQCTREGSNSKLTFFCILMSIGKENIRKQKNKNMHTNVFKTETDISKTEASSCQTLFLYLLNHLQTASTKTATRKEQELKIIELGQRIMQEYGVSKVCRACMHEDATD